MTEQRGQRLGRSEEPTPRDMPRRMWLPRHRSSPVPGAPDVGLDVLNLMETPGVQIAWFRELDEIPSTFDPREEMIVTDLTRSPAVCELLGVPVPEAVDDYPEALRSMRWMGRRVWAGKDVVSDAMASLAAGDPVFVKPRRGRKAFTGFVVESYTDIERFLHCEGAPSWCSSVVEWVTEWRVFVVRGIVEGVRHYKGGPMHPLPVDFIRRAILEFEGAPASYALDVGLIRHGNDLLPAIVEVNDGLSVGGYEVDSTAYCRLLWASWVEKIASQWSGSIRKVQRLTMTAEQVLHEFHRVAPEAQIWTRKNGRVCITSTEAMGDGDQYVSVYGQGDTLLNAIRDALGLDIV